MTSRREMAIRRRRRFIMAVLLIFALIVGIIAFAVHSLLNRSKSDGQVKNESSSSAVGKDEKTAADDKTGETNETNETGKTSETSETSGGSDPGKTSAINETGLDAAYSNYMLINADNPLPDNYDSDIRQYLVEIDPELRNNNYVTKIHRSVYPYITAMVKAAQADGVGLKVWSPFRSYADQKALFEKQVARVGGDEARAAMVVARPGTSEHNSGICADFNMADDAFENTEMYKWMCAHAQDYGFILRYPKDKEDKTGVIYESWHWRFVGIEAAKKINKSGLCLEEYLEKNNIKQSVSPDNF